MAPILLMAALGHLSILPWVAPRFPPHHVFYHLDKDSLSLVGEVISQPSRQAGRTKFVLDARRLGDGRNATAATGRVRVTVSGDALSIQRGQVLALTGRLRSLSNYQNPGGYDYRRQMAFRRIWASLYTSAARVRIVAARPGSQWTFLADRIRQSAARLIDSHAGGDQAAVLRALLIGNRSGITAELRQNFSRAGVSHILAISGLHIGIVGAVAFGFFSLMLRQFRPVLLRGWSRKAAAGLALIPVLAYGIIAGMSPSTQRAVLMAAVFFSAFWVERELDVFSSLAAAAWIILIVHPPSLFAVSFQLSFAAVFAIILGFHRTGRHAAPEVAKGDRHRIFSRLRRWLVGLVKVSLFATWGTLPLTMLYFNQLSFAGVVANLAVVPVIGCCVVPLGLAALCLWPVWPGAAGAMIALAAWLLSWMLSLVELLARIPPASLTTWTPTWMEVACFYLISLSAVLIVRNADRSRGIRQGLQTESSAAADYRGEGNGALSESMFRRFAGSGAVRWPVLLLSLSLLALGADAIYWMAQRFWHRDLKVTVFDVGHGNSALVECPGGQTLLIDGGGIADIGAFDPGARVLAPYLRQRKIMTVDTLVLSHPNSDHMNGLIFIADHFNVKQLWTNGEPVNTTGYRLLLQSAAVNRIEMPDFRSAAGRMSIGGVEVRLLYPPPDFLSRRSEDRWRTSNNNSLVVQLIYGKHSFLFPGDITRKAEADLTARCGPDLRSTVLIVPHHGSGNSSSAAFLAAVAPRLAIVSARDRGRGLHPHPTVVERYRKRNCRLLRTEIHGAIRLVSDGRHLKVDPFVPE